MNLSEIFPQRYHSALRLLGSKEWVRLITGKGLCEYGLNRLDITDEDKDKFEDQDFRSARELITNFVSVDASSCMHILTLSRMFADGPKLFRPTLDQCLAFENTLCNVTFDFYQQPFPVVVIELPDEYRKQILERYNCKQAPRFVFAHRHETNVIIISAWSNQHDVIVSVLSPRAEYKDIEDAFAKNRNHDRTLEYLERTYGKEQAKEIHESIIKGEETDFETAELVQRLGINFSLAMTMLGTKDIGPADPGLIKKLRNMRTRSKNLKRRKEGRRLSLTPVVYLIDFEQEIEFYKKEEDSPRKEGSDQERRSPKPHWRKGHFRMQPHGPHNSLRKLKFIKPILVMKEHFVGDKADTSVKYRSKNA